MYERAIELERAQRYGDALQAFIACKAQNEIAALLLERGNELLEQGYTDSVATAMNAIVAAQETLPTRLASLMGTIEAGRGRTDVSEAWFREGAAAASSIADAAEIAYRHACALARRSNAAECEKLLIPFLQQSSEIPPHLASSIMAVLAVAYVFTGRFSEATLLVDRAVELLDEHRVSPTVRAPVLQHAAWVQLYGGNIRPARLLASEAARLGVENALHEIASSAYSVLYNIAVDIDDDPLEGAAFLKSIQACGARTRNSANELYAMLGLYDLAAERGDFAEVALLQSELKRHEIAYGDAIASQTLLPAEALELAAAGDFKAAYDILAPSAPRQAVMDDRLALRSAEIAIYAAAAGLTAEAAAAESAARAALERILEKSLRTQRVQIYLALVAMLNGNEVATHALLQSLKSEIPPNARIRTLLDTITLLWDYWRGAENHDEFFRSLDRLWHHNLGGLAAVIEALPHPSLVAE